MGILKTGGFLSLIARNESVARIIPVRLEGEVTEIPELCPSLPRPFSLLIMDVREFQLYGSVNQDLIAVIQARSIVYTPPIRLISRIFFETEAYFP